MGYLNTDWQGADIPVPPSDRLNLPGNWAHVRFDHDYADSGGHHSGSSQYIGNGNGVYVHGVLKLELLHFGTEVEIQIREVEVDADTGAALEVHKAHEWMTTPHDNPPDYPAKHHLAYPVFLYVNSGRKMRFEVSQWPKDPANASTGYISAAQFAARMDSAI